MQEYKAEVSPCSPVADSAAFVPAGQSKLTEASSFQVKHCTHYSTSYKSGTAYPA